MAASALSCGPALANVHKASRRLSGARVAAKIAVAPRQRSLGGTSTTTITRAGLAEPLKADGKIPPLATVDMLRFVNDDGIIMPRHAPGAPASVFAVFDEAKKLQYVGFSKDIRNSLRTMVARRPEMCHYFKSVDVAEMDQHLMLAVRTEWFEEMGGPPPGNSDPEQQAIWQKAPEAGSAEEVEKLIEDTLKTLKARGLKEPIEFEEEALKENKLEVKASAMQTEAELKAAAKLEETRRDVCIEVNKKKIEFTLAFSNVMRTSAGYVIDCVMTMKGADSKHRVIVNDMYPRFSGFSASDLVERGLAFLMSKNVIRHTEGVRPTLQFPINYFAISEIEIWWPEFGELYSLPGDTESHWNWWWKGYMKERDKKFTPPKLVGSHNNAVRRGEVGPKLVENDTQSSRSNEESIAG